MHWLIDIPLPVRLAVLVAASAVIASLLNAAIYEFAYNRRLFSPWQRTPTGVEPRGLLDRVPVLGWLRLRRDCPTLGKRFWLRPLALEILFPIIITALYWWEVDQHGLIEPQLRVATPVDWPALSGVLHAQFLAHALLAAFMWIATFIDLDEKTIPDPVTWPGTILGLLLMAAAPMAALPNVEESPIAPRIGIALTQPGGAPVVGLNGSQVYVQAMQPFSPYDWPEQLVAKRATLPLAIGIACWWLWGFAVSDRWWPPKRIGYGNKLGDKLLVWFARFRRDLLGFPLRNVLLAGTLGVLMLWFTDGSSWLGLINGLLGLVLGGLLVWSVRVVGSAAMGREAMGFGDVMLMMMIGVLLGWQACLVVFFLAPFAGLLLGLLNLVFGRGDAIPYGPFLCLAAAFTVVKWGVVWTRLEPMFAVGGLVPVVLIVCVLLLGVLLMLIQMVKRLFR